MIDSLKVGRKITESKYLNQENSFRYRNILRIAFYKYEKMKYWLDQNEIYEEIKKLEDFENYTIENLKQDLDMLVEFKNFTAMQDTKKTRTIEEFKNRKFKYQITPITIELERTLIKLENIPYILGLIPWNYVIASKMNTMLISSTYKIPNVVIGDEINE